MPDIESDMQLPKGKTCLDCWHYEWCSIMYGIILTDRRCDFSPSKFKLIADVVKQKELKEEK